MVIGLKILQRMVTSRNPNPAVQSSAAEAFRPASEDSAVAPSEADAEQERHTPPIHPEPSGQADASAVVKGGYAYGFFLGREPESEGHASAKGELSPEVLINELIASVEFKLGVAKPLLDNAAYPEGRFVAPPQAELLAWAADSFPLSPRARSALRACPTWRAAHACVFGDPNFANSAHTPENASLISDMTYALTAEASQTGVFPHLQGLRIAAMRGVDLDRETGRAVLLDDDPQIHLRFEPGPAAQASAVLFEIEMTGEAGAATRPRVYLDFGLGFDERRSLRLLHAGNDAYRALVPLPGAVKALRFDPSARPGTVLLKSISLQPVEASLPATTRSAEEAEFVWRLAHDANHLFAAEFTSVSYARWREINEVAEVEDYRRMEAMLVDFRIRPKFSFIMPTYNTPSQYLIECLDCLLGQNYSDFEVCIADDNSPNVEVRNILKTYAERDGRVKLALRSENGHISKASNSALALATGDYIVLVDHDDLIPRYALWTIAYYINLHPEAAVLYSDEDKIDLAGDRSDPYFKSDFNQFLMYGHNLVSHLGVYRRDLIESIGGFREGYEGSQDYDLLLRCLDVCGGDKIVHVPHVLYHWRMIPGSTAISADQKSYAVIAAGKAIDDHFRRRNLPLKSVASFAPGNTGVAVCPTPGGTAKISIIIPTRDGLDFLQPCVDSFFDQLGASTELIIVDNGSIEAASLSYFEALQAQSPYIRVIRHDAPFNYSELNNIGAEAALGDILCLLNNDTEALDASWLERARGLLSIPDVGVVGAKLAYPDASVQHFGIYVGAGEHRVAAGAHLHLPIEDPGPFSKARLIQEFSAVTGACLFIRKHIYDQVGGLDTMLAVAYNDVDLCLKVREAGFKVICDPDILLIHKESRTRGSDATGEKARRLDRDAALMRERWGPVLDSDPYYSPNLSLDPPDFSLPRRTRAPLPWRVGLDPKGAAEKL